MDNKSNKNYKSPGFDGEEINKSLSNKSGNRIKFNYMNHKHYEDRNRTEMSKNTDIASEYNMEIVDHNKY